MPKKSLEEVLNELNQKGATLDEFRKELSVFEESDFMDYGNRKIENDFSGVIKQGTLSFDIENNDVADIEAKLNEEIIDIDEDQWFNDDNSFNKKGAINDLFDPRKATRKDIINRVYEADEVDQLMDTLKIDDTKYKKFEDLMHDLENGGDINKIKADIESEFGPEFRKYAKEYLNVGYDDNVLSEFKKDLDFINNNDSSVDGFYDAAQRVSQVNQDTFRTHNYKDFVDANGEFNINSFLNGVRNTSINPDNLIERSSVTSTAQQTSNQRTHAVHQRKVQRSQRRARAKQRIPKQNKGAKNREEFEKIVERRQRFKKTDDLRAKNKDSSLTSNERRQARQDLVREYQKDQKRYKDLKDKSRDMSLSDQERLAAAREARELKRSLEIEQRVRKHGNGTMSGYYDGRINNTERGIVEDYINKKYKANEYDDFMKDLDLAGRDYLDIEGNELGKVNKFINKSLRKAELKIKGYFKGDYSEYDEYVAATKRLEGMQNRDFDVYETENLFDDNGRLKNIDDIDNLKPVRTTNSKDAFDDWQQARKKAATEAEELAAKSKTGASVSKNNLLKSHPNAKKLFTAQGVLGVGINLFNTVSTYKEERKEGKGVISSAARAGVDFALGEVLGMKYMGIMAAQALPRMAVKGIEGMGKLTREKNNMQRHEAFGYANFQDTQQLATMRQSGMEMAKMANYNLQQTLMGNEAKYMHR